MSNEPAATLPGTEEVTMNTPRVLTDEEIQTLLKGQGPLLTKQEIKAIEVPKSFQDRLVSAVKGAFWTPVVIGIGGLAAPLGVFILATGVFSGGSGVAAAFGNMAGNAMAIGSCIAGVGVYGALIFGGPIGWTVLGGALAASSVAGAYFGFRSKVDRKKTDALRAPFEAVRNKADWLASPRRAEQLQAAEKSRLYWAAKDAEDKARKEREARDKAMGAALAEAVAKDPERVRDLLASVGVDIPRDSNGGAS